MKTYVKLLWIHGGKIQITREEDPYPGNIPFADVPKTLRASRYADTAYTKWILEWFYTTKDSERYLSPNKLATRQELVTMMMKTYRFINPKDVNPNFVTQFVDVRKSNPYYSYIVAAEELWFIQWYSRNGKKYFDWAINTTREQFAKLVALPFKDQLVIDIDATILNSDIYKEIVSALHTTKSGRLVFINALIDKISQLDDSYIMNAYGVEKQVFLDSLYTLLLGSEG